MNCSNVVHEPLPERPSRFLDGFVIEYFHMEDQQSSANTSRSSASAWIAVGILSILLLLFVVLLFSTQQRIAELRHQIASPVQETITVDDEMVDDNMEEQEVSLPIIYTGWKAGQEAEPIEIREPVGDLGELSIPQEIIDQLLTLKSCDVFLDSNQEVYEYGLYPWHIDDSVECVVVGDESRLVISLLGIHGTFEGLPNISDAIILIEDGQPFIFQNVHNLATWKEVSLAKKLYQKYPEAGFPNEEYGKLSADYLEGLEEYVAEPDGEIAWARSDLQRIIEQQLERF